MLELMFPVGLVALLIASVLPLIGLKVKNCRTPMLASLVLTCAGSIFLIVFSLEILLAEKTYSLLAYQIAAGFQFSFAIDRLAAFFIFLIAVVSAPVAVYSIQYLEHIPQSSKRNLISSLMCVFIASMVLVVSSSTMFGFLFFWEIMALSSFLLVMTEFERKETGKAGIFYFIMTHLSTLFLLFAFIFLYSSTGTLNIQPIIAEPLVTTVAFVSLFVAFGIKAGIIPFHKWLPYAHPASPSNISALMSGVMLKVAIYGIVRFTLLMPLELWWGLVFLTAGSTSAILGVIYALKEHDIKRLLAYHSIENIGIILIGLGLYVVFSVSALPAIATLALIGALFHTLNHALFKSLLFMSAGSIVNATETRNIEEMGGLIKRMPRTALMFLIGAVSISALPPFNGFVSELMIFQSFFQSVMLGNAFLELMLVVSLAVFALTSALAAACFVKAFGVTFLALPRSKEAKEATESPKLMLLGQAIIAGLCIVLGVFSYQILGLFGYASLVPNMFIIGIVLLAFYVFAWAAMCTFASRRERLAETWGCGIPSQNSKMEYTASGFSEPIVTILKSIFRTQKTSERTCYDDKQVIFKSGKAEIHFIKFFEERLYIPIANCIRKISLKVSNLQRGDVDLHVAYSFLVIVLFLLIIWWFA